MNVGVFSRSGFISIASGPSTARSMILCACGALIGLSIAGYGLFTSAGTSTRSVAPENVATVNRRPILRSDFVTQVETETGRRFEETSRADQLRVLDEMVREELLVQRALELDFGETDQNARNALATAISDQTIAEVTTSRASEAQLREYYESQPGRWSTEGTMTLRHFLMPAAGGAAPSLDKANAAVNALKGGAPVEKVLAAYGMQELPRQDNEYYFTEKYRLGDALFAASEMLPAGALSNPVAANDGIHVIQMFANSRPVPLDFKAARAQVLSDYDEAARTRLMDNTLKFLRDRATLLVAKDYASDYRP